MPDETKLVGQFNRGSREALCEIYQLYKKDLYGLALSLLHDAGKAEDVVHDVFVSLAQRSGGLELRGSLKQYLLTSAANRARETWRRHWGREPAPAEAAAEPLTELTGEQYAILTEEARRLQALLRKLPYEQREVILLHLHHDMSFREIADAQGVSINTIQSRYRYGMEKIGQYLKEGCEHERVQTHRRLGSEQQA